MTKFTETGEVVIGSNRIPAKESYIYVGRLIYSKVMAIDNLPPNNIPWTKYQIKETDMRIKTATFSSPQYMDLTLGRYIVRIVSPYHENFTGFILSVEYDEDNRVYNYQCQDWSRNYMYKTGTARAGDVTMIDYLKNLLIRQDLDFGSTFTSENLKKYSDVLSGLRPAGDYAQEKWGSIIKFNPMTEKPQMIIRDTPNIEIIRDLVFGSGAYIDLWWNDYGILQVEPYQKDDFFNTGLHLVSPEAVDRKFKFDTTNIITGAVVRNPDKPSGEEGTGKRYWNDLLTNFFGYFNVAGADKDLWTSLGNKATTTTTSTKSTSSSSSSSSSSSTSNPFKGKKIWINADNGSDDMKNTVANKLKNKGYTVHVGRTGSNVHYEDYTNVTKDYVYITMYNGFCAGTIQEAYSSSIQNKLKNKNVQLVVMFDTRNWTNPQGMKPYRYGDFTGYTAHRAWDDNFSSGDPTIKNVSSWLKNKGAVYCAYPNADGLVEQFEAGGYFKWKK